ncbi:MAG: type II toxin-antitoxin system PemK/MazF family toxin [Acidobacteriota bacterium]
MSTRPKPKRGEIWLVDLEPTIGTEIKKRRPAIVVSSDSVGRLPIKLVAPITDWKPHFIPDIWQVRIDPNSSNGLNKISSIDTLQLRGVDTQRFIHKLGQVDDSKLEEIVLAIGFAVEHP